MIRDIYTAIKRPRITEKATEGTDNNAYTFEADRDATKIEIRNAIEKIYNVKVKKVATMRVKGKWRRVGRHLGRTPDWKKTIVTLHDGHSIDIL